MGAFNVCFFFSDAASPSKLMNIHEDVCILVIGALQFKSFPLYKKQNGNMECSKGSWESVWGDDLGRLDRQV